METCWLKDEMTIGVRIKLCSNSETLGIHNDDDGSLTNAVLAAGDEVIWKALGCLPDRVSSFAYWHGGAGDGKLVTVDYRLAGLDDCGPVGPEDTCLSETKVPVDLRKMVEAACFAAHDAMAKTAEEFTAEDEEEEERI